MTNVRWLVGFVALLMVLVRGAWAADTEVGNVVNADPKAQMGKGGAFKDAAQGAPVSVGDDLHTYEVGRLHVDFADYSVLELGSNVQVTVGDQVYTPSGSRSVLRLESGAIRVVVKSAANVQCQVNTNTAVIHCAGTDFIVIYDGLVTKVIGIEGNVRVESSIPRLRGVQTVAPGQMTTVGAGQRPTPPVAVGEEDVRRYVEGFRFIAHGQPESLTIGHPVLAGNPLPGDDLGPWRPWMRLPPGSPLYEDRTPGDQVKPPFSQRGNLGIDF
jgi:hypothetical protein